MTEDIYGTISKVIRKRREELGYSRERVAREADMSLNMLFRLEHQQKNIGVQGLIRVLEVLGLTLEIVERGECVRRKRWA